MSKPEVRTFDDRPAVRERTPLLVGLVGPSGSGKTYSALRLATGIQQVTGGDIFFVDTEARRALHYAERFKFRHVAFGAPFSPLDYLAAIEHCVAKGAGTIVVDSMSHEHEGPGGVLEMHQAEHARLGGREGMKLLAWGAPKSARRRLINSILQLPTNFIFCFRAKEKLKIERGKEPEKLGYQPISGDEFIYEMTLKCLLLPGANGVPTWQSDMLGEKAMIKLPEQFRAMFGVSPAPQLTEEIGASLAKWSAGAPSAPTMSLDDLIAALSTCSDAATLRQLGEVSRVALRGASKLDRERIETAGRKARARIEEADKAPPVPEPELPLDAPAAQDGAA